MDRVSTGAVVVAFFACVSIAGCGGGGSGTSLLAVSTTSLPNGTVGVMHTPTLGATGGTPPYTWSQASGGAMPAGVSLSSTGMFNGTPTAAGTFGPYVITVNDSKNTSASSLSLSIMIASAQLGVTIANLPNGTVGVPYSTALTPIGGTSPYTWKQTSGGAMPPGLVPLT